MTDELLAALDAEILAALRLEAERWEEFAATRPGEQFEALAQIAVGFRKAAAMLETAWKGEPRDCLQM